MNISVSRCCFSIPYTFGKILFCTRRHLFNPLMSSTHDKSNSSQIKKIIDDMLSIIVNLREDSLSSFWSMSFGGAEAFVKAQFRNSGKILKSRELKLLSYAINQ